MSNKIKRFRCRKNRQCDSPWLPKWWQNRQPWCSGLWNLIQSTPFKKQTWAYAENTMLPLNVTVDMSSLVSSDPCELHFSIAGPADVGNIANFFMANIWPDCPRDYVRERWSRGQTRVRRVHPSRHRKKIIASLLTSIITLLVLHQINSTTRVHVLEIGSSANCSRSLCSPSPKQGPCHHEIAIRLDQETLDIAENVEMSCLKFLETQSLEKCFLNPKPRLLGWKHTSDVFLRRV